MERKKYRTDLHDEDLELNYQQGIRIVNYQLSFIGIACYS